MLLKGHLTSFEELAQHQTDEKRHWKNQLNAKELGATYKVLPSERLHSTYEYRKIVDKRLVINGSTVEYFDPMIKISQNESSHENPFQQPGIHYKPTIENII